MTRNFGVACSQAIHNHRVSISPSLGSAVSSKGQEIFFWASLEPRGSVLTIHFHGHWPFNLLFIKGAGYLCSSPAFGVTQLSQVQEKNTEDDCLGDDCTPNSPPET